MRALFAIVAVVAVVVLVMTSRTMRTVPPSGIPVAQLADGKPHPEVLLTTPLPDWIPLPEGGTVVTAGVYPPQPPYGAVAAATFAIDDSVTDFAAAYGRRLDRAGFSMGSIPIQFNLIIDRPDLQFEADEREGGHVIYITLRHSGSARFALLTFWSPPAPHLP